MKKLSLNSTIVLEQREARCNFCGERDKKCVKGSLPLEFEHTIYKTKWMQVIEDYRHGEVIKDFDISILGNRIITDSEIRKIIKGDIEWKDVIIDKEKKTKTDEADICHDCIKQLATLIK